MIVLSIEVNWSNTDQDEVTNSSLRGDHQADCKEWFGRYYKQRVLLEQGCPGLKNPVFVGNQELFTDEA